MNYASMTKNELLATAKIAAIVGRHDMSKDQLVEALDRHDAQSDEFAPDGQPDGLPQPEADVVVERLEREAETSMAFDPDQVKETKRRYPSMAKRDSTGKVIRRGVKFNMNVPFRQKLYYLPAHLADESKWTETYRQAMLAAPPQAQLVIKAMGKLGITSPDEALIGRQIVDAAKERGGVRTQIGSAELFAYYRRLLERLGVVHYQGVPVDDESGEAEETDDGGNGGED